MRELGALCPFLAACLSALAAPAASPQTSQAPPAPSALELGVESQFIQAKACVGYDLGDPFVLTGLMGRDASGNPAVVNPPPLGVPNNAPIDRYPYFAQVETSYAYIPPSPEACPENRRGKLVFAYVDNDVTKNHNDRPRRKSRAMGDRPRSIAAESIQLEDIGRKLPQVARMEDSDFDGNDPRLTWVQDGTVYLFNIGVRRGANGIQDIVGRAGEWHGFQVMRSTDCGKTWTFDSFVSAQDTTILPACPKEAWSASGAHCENTDKSVFTFKKSSPANGRPTEDLPCHCNSSSDYPIPYVDPYDRTQWLISGGTTAFYRQKDKERQNKAAHGYVARFRLPLHNPVHGLYPPIWDKFSPLFAYTDPEEIFFRPKAVTSLPERGRGSGTGGWLVLAGADANAMLPMVMITRDRGAHWQSVNLAQKDEFKKFDLSGNPVAALLDPFTNKPSAFKLEPVDEPNAELAAGKVRVFPLEKPQFKFDPVLRHQEQTVVKLADEAVFDEEDPKNKYQETEANAFSRVTGDFRETTPTGWARKITMSLARGAAEPGNPKIKRVFVSYPRADMDLYTQADDENQRIPIYLDVSLLTLECDPTQVEKPCTNIKLKKLAKLKARKGESTFNGRFIQADPRYNKGAENENDVTFVYYESLGSQGKHASANPADDFFDPPYVVEKYVIFDSAGRVKQTGTLSPAPWTPYGRVYWDYSEVGVPVPVKQGQHREVGFLTFSNFTPQLEPGTFWDQRGRSNLVGRRVDPRRSAACGN